MGLVVVTTLIDILGLLAIGVGKLWLLMGFLLLALVCVFSSIAYVRELVCTVFIAVFVFLYEKRQWHFHANSRAL